MNATTCIRGADCLHISFNKLYDEAAGKYIISIFPPLLRDASEYWDVLGERVPLQDCFLDRNLLAGMQGLHETSISVNYMYVKESLPKWLCTGNVLRWICSSSSIDHQFQETHPLCQYLRHQASSGAWHWVLLSIHRCDSTHHWYLSYWDIVTPAYYSVLLRAAQTRRCHSLWWC
jgi:hypothetical protein